MASAKGVRAIILYTRGHCFNIVKQWPPVTFDHQSIIRVCVCVTACRSATERAGLHASRARSNS